jgi:hypothetical protein
MGRQNILVPLPIGRLKFDDGTVIAPNPPFSFVRFISEAGRLTASILADLL